MSSAISSFRGDVRAITRDTNSANYHHTDAEIDLFTVDAIRHMRSVRPESRYVDGELTDITFPTAAAEIAAFAVEFDGRWRLGIVYYAAARAFETDVTDSVNRELAAGYFKQADAVFAS